MKYLKLDTPQPATRLKCCFNKHNNITRVLLPLMLKVHFADNTYILLGKWTFECNFLLLIEYILYYGILFF